MKLIWHIVRKDGRRFWVVLALWTLVITAKHLVDWRVLHVITEDGSWVERMKIFSNFFFGLQILVGYILAGVLVLEDSPCGTTAFWMTRPVSGARMIGAKLLASLVLLVILPVLVSLPWWRMNSGGGREVALLLRELLGWETWTVGLAIVVATFTGSFSRFLAWTLILPVSAIVVMTMWGGSPNMASMGVDFFALAPLGGIAAAVLVKYQTRQRGLSMAIMGTSAALALAIIFG